MFHFFPHYFLMTDFLIDLLIDFFLTQRSRESLKMKFCNYYLIIKKKEMINAEEKQSKYECINLCCVEEIKEYILLYAKNCC